MTGASGGAANSIEITGGSTPTHTGGPALPGTAVTGRLVFVNNTTNSGTSYPDFPRISDNDGSLTSWDVAYLISNLGSDNSNIDGYKVPVTYYARDEFGNNIILLDTFTISEAKPEITIAPLGGPVQVTDGGGCSNSYMDLLVSNNTIYGADNVYIAALKNSNVTIVSIEDAPGATPSDPIVSADTNQYDGGSIYAELGGMIAGGRRTVRVYFNTTACEDSIKVYSNFGCNYPGAREPNNTGNTLDSAYINFNAVPPRIMSGPQDGNKYIADLCGTQTLEVEVRNVKNPNLTSVLAGIKLPSYARYVAGSAEIAYPSNTYEAAPTVTVVSTDSVVIDLTSDVDLSHACGLPGPDEASFPTVGYPQNNSSSPNTVKFRFDVEFVACATGTSGEVYYNVEGNSFCGASTTTEGVFNLIYVGASSVPNLYSCQPANSIPLTICSDSGIASTVYDSVYINNLSGPTTTGADSVAITIASDTARFDLANFSVLAPWTNPVITTSPEGRPVLTFAIPSGIAVEDSILMVMQYDLIPKTNNVCFAAAIPCAAIAQSMTFFSTVKVECPGKGITCSGLGIATRGAGYVPRELACCKQGLGNFVWLDDDEDGIQDSNEPGVAGVTVDLFDNGPDGLPNTADDVRVGSTVTDAYGKYYFDDIPTGKYNLGFTPPSNYTFTDPVGAGDNSDNTNSEVDTAAANFGRTGTFDITSGEQDSTVDAGLVLPKPTTATVGDFVWFDTDGDGTQDTGEPGVAGVVVTLLDASGNIVASTVTDATGKYLFKDVEPGTYSVKFKAPMGTVFTTTGGDGVAGTSGDSETDSDVNASGATPSFTVAAGDNIRNVDAGIVPQSDQKCSLGDRVWYDEDQDGVQDPGEVGIQGVTVELKDSAGNVIATTTTDVNGNYSFDNLNPGKYMVRFTRPTGYLSSPASSDVTIYGDGADLSDSDADAVTGETSVIELIAGRRNSTVDAGYFKVGVFNSIGNRVWLDTDKDGVQDAGEVGVKGITVKLLDGSGNPVNNPATGDPYVVMTDENGEYKFVGLPDGNYQIQFDNLPPGYTYSPSNTPGDNADNTNSDANLNGRTPTFNLAGGENDMTADAGIYSGDAGLSASLGDKVFFDLDNDGIQDDGETGVAGITVTLKDYGPDGVPGGGDDGPDRTTTTNAQGEYIFTGLEASNYVVQFSDLPTGYAPSAANQGSDPSKDSDGGALSSGVSSTGVINLSAGEENLDVDLGIYKSGVNSIGNLVWMDADMDGQQDGVATEPGVPGVQVTLLDGDGNIFDIDPSTPGVQPYVTTTDENGYYLFTDLPDGTYSTKFSNLPPGYEFTTANSGADATDSDVNASTGKSTNVTVTGGQTDLTLDAGIFSSSKAALGNFVWSDDDGDGIQDANEAGIPGILVTLYDNLGNPVATTITDANGKYLFPNLDPGTYTVGFDNLPEGTVFTGQDSGSVDGVDSDVNPATGRTSSITLAAGDVNLTVDAGVKPPSTATVGNYVWFDMDRDGLQDPEEPPVPGVIVNLKDANGNIIATTTTDGDGKYLFTNVPAGTGYTVEFNANLPYLGPSISSPFFTTQDPAQTNASGNRSIVPNTAAYNGNVSSTPPFNVTPGSHTRLLDAGITSAFPLPVEMIDLSVQWVGEYGEVSWSTAMEINSSHFIVERSLDGVHFIPVGRVESKAFNGNSNELLNYVWDENLETYPNNVFYYRVIQVDFNGAQDVSQILVLNRIRLNPGLDAGLTPNPANSDVQIAVNALGYNEYDYELIDVKGDVILKETIMKNANEDNFNAKIMNVSNLASGVYFVRFTIGENIITKKLVVVH